LKLKYVKNCFQFCFKFGFIFILRHCNQVHQHQNLQQSSVPMGRGAPGQVLGGVGALDLADSVTALGALDLAGGGEDQVPRTYHTALAAMQGTKLK
jgi:hypothetical protein